MNSTELRRQRADLIAQSKEWLNKVEADAGKEGRDLTAEEDGEWSRRMADVDRLETDAKKAERNEVLSAREAELAQPLPRRSVSPAPQNQIATLGTNRQPSRAERNRLLKTWLGYGHAGVPGFRMNFDAASVHQCAEQGWNLNHDNITFRSMNTSTGGAGGNSTFTTTYPDLQTEMKYFSPILSKVDVKVTADGNNFTLPRGTDVANVMSIVSQAGGSGTSTDPTFDKVTLGGYFFRYIEQVTYEMLQDAVFDVESWVTGRLAERAARTLEKYIVSGTGSSQPTGLIAAATAADSGTPAITLAATKKNFYQFEDLFDLFKATDLAYRYENTLVLHDSSVWDLRKIKDGQQRYIWDVNNTLVQNAQPDKIAGFNYLISNSIDASGSFSKDIAVFANLPRMVVRIAEGVQITRLNELYRGNGLIGFEVLMRFDCNYVGHAASISRARTPAS